jgi:S-adenosylmethionine:tRNA ribosyltransferase-isomerase
MIHLIVIYNLQFTIYIQDPKYNLQFENQNMKLSDFDYHLPLEYIAQRPVKPRDHSRLMVLDQEKKSIDHHHFYDLVDLLRPDDVLVANKSKVIPARLYGKTETGEIEILLLKRLDEQRWEAMGKPGKSRGRDCELG